MGEKERARISPRRATLPTMAVKDPSLNLASETSKERERAKRTTTAEDPPPVVEAAAAMVATVAMVAMVADPTTLATARFTVLVATANTAESSEDTVLTASSDPVAPLLASASDQDLVALAVDSVESDVDSVIESEDVQLPLVAELVVSMSELVVALPDFVELVLVLVVPLELALLLPVVLLPLDSVVEALLSVPMAVDVVSELVSMAASALVPLAKVPSQALEASLELELTPLP